MKHLILCGSVLALALGACASHVVGQELSDGERLSHGIKLYNNMKYEEAIQRAEQATKEGRAAFLEIITKEEPDFSM